MLIQLHIGGSCGCQGQYFKIEKKTAKTHINLMNVGLYLDPYSILKNELWRIDTSPLDMPDLSF